MRFFLIFCLFFSFAQFLMAQDNDFYDNVLSDVKATTFIVIDVDSNEYKGKAIIENADLYVFLKEKRGFDERKYQSFVKNLLTNKNKLSICATKIEDIGFKPVRKVEIVDAYVSKGKNFFIKHYFEGRFINLENVKDVDEMNAIASELFDWQIATYIDDISGRLAMRNYIKD